MGTIFFENNMTLFYRIVRSRFQQVSKNFKIFHGVCGYLYLTESRSGIFLMNRTARFIAGGSHFVQTVFTKIFFVKDVFFTGLQNTAAVNTGTVVHSIISLLLVT